MVTSELLPLSSPRYENGPPKFPAVELGRLVDRAIRESKFVDFEKLCIKEGEKVWSVFIDIYSINDDGNLIDLCNNRSSSRIKMVKMPKYDEETGKVLYDEHTTKGLPLTKDIPICITPHKIGNKIIVDPTQEEEDVSEAKITIGANVEGVISSMQKGSPIELSIQKVHEMLDLSEKVRKKVFLKIEKFL